MKMKCTRLLRTLAAGLSLLAFVLMLGGCGGNDAPGLNSGDGLTRGKPLPSTPCKIAFQRKLTNSVQVFTMFTNGSGVTQLTPSSSNGGPSNWSPSWSPDGTQICFTSNRDGLSRIYIMKADGSGPTLLTHPSPDVGDSSPDWCPAPTVNKIVFTRSDSTLPSQGKYLYVTDLSGNEEQVTFGLGYRDGNPTWSANGQFLAFNRWNAVPPDTDGLHVLRLSDQATWSLVPGAYGGYYPDWSPLGGKVAYTYNGCVWYVTVNPETGQMTGGPYQVTTAASYATIQEPSWSPDEKAITFSAEVGKKFEDRIFTVAVPSPGSPPNQPVDIGSGLDPDWSPVLP